MIGTRDFLHLATKSRSGALAASPESSTASYLDSLTKETFESKVTSVFDKATTAFPFWVVGAALLGFFRPQTLAWFSGDCITYALATTMICMGTTLTVSDFKAIFKEPRGVAIGTALQFTVMPSLAFLMARVFSLPPALAAGICLVGASPGGTASNLVTLIGGGDVALSVALTTVSTMLATIVTPLLARALIGGVVAVSVKTLMISTAQVVFLPVLLGLFLSKKAPKLCARTAPYTPLGCVLLVALICGSVVAQSGRSVVQATGGRLLAAVASLHTGGFLLGYFAAKRAGMAEKSSRTVSIEVGMQNSALAVVLARSAFSDPLTALPGAVSATTHCIISSGLAAFWRLKNKQE